MLITIQMLLARASELNSDSPRLDIECLLCKVLACPPSYLRTWPEKQLTDEQLSQFEALFIRRKNGEPIAHLTELRAFWTLELNVTPDTLIPRPDTETLIDAILSLDLPKKAKILDLGTGTGAIALALASEQKAWRVSATDFKPEVVKLAQSNAIKHQLEHVSIFQSDWFSHVNEHDFDLIVSNPPYIDPEDAHLNQGDVRFEPRSALIADKQGLADLEHIIFEARAYLKPGGFLVLEHGYNQAQQVQRLFTDAGYYAIRSIQDYGQQDRMTLAQFSLSK